MGRGTPALAATSVYVGHAVLQRTWLPTGRAPWGWQPLNYAMLYHSPYRPSGAGTVYYQDAKAGMVYHDSGYW